VPFNKNQEKTLYEDHLQNLSLFQGTLIIIHKGSSREGRSLPFQKEEGLFRGEKKGLSLRGETTQQTLRRLSEKVPSDLKDGNLSKLRSGKEKSNTSAEDKIYTKRSFALSSRKKRGTKEEKKKRPSIGRNRKHLSQVETCFEARNDHPKWEEGESVGRGEREKDKKREKRDHLHDPGGRALARGHERSKGKRQIT